MRKEKKKKKEKDIELLDKKKENKALNILSKVFKILDLVAAGFLIYSIMLLSGIETKLLIIIFLLLESCSDELWLIQAL